MTLEEKINGDLKAAMLAKNDVALRALRAVKSAILLAKTSGGSATLLSTDEEMKILQRLVKQRKESVEIYQKEGRADLASSEQDEIAVIEKYLPAQMSEDEITLKLKSIIQELGATGPGDTGKVMAVASKSFSGQADNKLVSQIVKSLLSNN